jgi:hypothetical protein
MHQRMTQGVAPRSSVARRPSREPARNLAMMLRTRAGADLMGDVRGSIRGAARTPAGHLRRPATTDPAEPRPRLRDALDQALRPTTDTPPTPRRSSHRAASATRRTARDGVVANDRSAIASPVPQTTPAMSLSGSPRPRSLVARRRPDAPSLPHDARVRRSQVHVGHRKRSGPAVACQA